MRIGILALQGGVEEHQEMLTQLGAQVVTVRRAAELEGLNGLVLPGGESSVIDRLARTLGVSTALYDAITKGLPVLATCAGMIYLAKDVQGKAPGQQTLGVLDISVDRNSFGSQQHSFETTLNVARVENAAAVFIRAPKVLDPKGTQVVATLPDGAIVGVRQDHILALSFHPESTEDTRIHQWWLDEFVATAN